MRSEVSSSSDSDSRIAFYTQDGVMIRSVFYDSPEGFHVYRLPNQERVYFSGDKVLDEASDRLQSVEHAVHGLIFQNCVDYHTYLYQTPFLLAEGGLSTTCPASREDWFNRAVMACNSEALNAVLYVSEYASLQGCLLNSLSEMSSSMSGYFKSIAEVDLLDGRNNEEGLFVYSGFKADKVFAQISSFFVYAASCLDYLSKCVHECIFLNESFDVPRKLKSRNVQYGGIKKIDRYLKTDGTIFESRPLIHFVEDLRNDIVHNKSVNEIQRVFVSVQDGLVEKRYTLLPDYDPSTGRLDRWHSRNRFYAQGNTANDLLPKLYFELMELTVGTLDALLEHLKIKLADEARRKVAFDENYGYKTLSKMIL